MILRADCIVFITLKYNCYFMRPEIQFYNADEFPDTTWCKCLNMVTDITRKLATANRSRVSIHGRPSKKFPRI